MRKDNDPLREALEQIMLATRHSAAHPVVTDDATHGVIQDVYDIAVAALSTKPPETAGAVAWRYKTYGSSRWKIALDRSKAVKYAVDETKIEPLYASPPNPWRPDREAATKIIDEWAGEMLRRKFASSWHFGELYDALFSLPPAQPSEGVLEELHLANLALAQSNARLFEEAQTAARLLAEARAAPSSPAQPSEGVPAPVNQTLASKLCTATAFRPCMASEAHREGREVKYCDWCKNTAIEIAAFCHAAFVPLSPAQNNWHADPRTVETAEEMRKMLELFLCGSNAVPEEFQERIYAAIEFLLTPSHWQADGWQLVPKEPTEEMLEAGENTFVSGYTGTPVSTPGGVYAAMLAVAPPSQWQADPRTVEACAKIVEQFQQWTMAKSIADLIRALAPSLPDHGFSHGIRKDNQ